ncbi:cysteine desulfurase [Spirulina subsalsa FACHB-351]|uniref:cysteine desulfurase n=1 Tax=Spirulina subsalsa FACHB-351 TaxID=234711 RepID=A0ABT3L092_9CYAN|nr:cysteine desulfurase family protein [Spirulina subsalsa]MCW6034907.1 cysteine desulfurase [Spirulina subsalsa FACHB-351]
MQIYLDYSATTPQRPEVTARIQEVLQQEWGNPSSLHAWGQRAATVMEMARLQVAQLINAPHPESIFFTSGGTEADNWAIFGVTQQYRTPQHLIISSVEHSAIAEPARILEQQGWQVTRLPVNRQGRVNPLDLKAALKPNTVLVSIIYGQSEVGTLQPIETLAQIARCHNVLFHTDAVQVAGRLPLDVQQLGVDLLSLSGHKLYGPQGSGALYVREGVQLAPMIYGGGQEQRLRSGTQAVPTLAGFGVAAEWALAEMTRETPRLRELRDRLFDQLACCSYLVPTGDRLHRLPHHVSLCLTQGEITGKTLVRQLNLAGIGISAGSACHSGKLTPSPILKAMGYSDQEALAGIRFTLGRETTLEDIDWTAMVLKQVLDRLLPKFALSGC